jgi:DNA-binding transcriptional LysR family regulator
MPIARTQAAGAAGSLTLGDMEVVLALVRGRTLAEAAARLGADPSTVFRSLQRIEKALGQRLFERGRTGYLPTEGAAEVARHAERVEAELEAARSALSGPADAVTGRVRLSTTDAVMRGLVLPLLPGLAMAHPQLRVEVRTGNELVSLTRRDADLALRATRKPPEHVVGRHLGTMRFVVVAAAKRGRGAPALPDAAWIAPDEALPDHPSVQWRRRHFPKLQPRLLVDGITGVADAVAAGVGIGIVPVFVAAADARLKPVTDTLDGCESELWILAHPESRHLRRIATVYQALVDGIALPD